MNLKGKLNMPSGQEMFHKGFHILKWPYHISGLSFLQGCFKMTFLFRHRFDCSTFKSLQDFFMILKSSFVLSFNV